MRTFSRIGMVSLVSAAGFLGPTTGWAQQPTMTSSGIVAVSGGREFHVADAAGHYLAVHFLGHVNTPEATSFVRDYLRLAPTVAGFVHVFVTPDDQAAASAWAAQFGADAGAVYVDRHGALAKELSVPAESMVSGDDSTVPATIVFGPDSKEIFRHLGQSSADSLSFASFARQLTQKTRVPALADYNVAPDRPVAVGGYDVVAYFAQIKAVRGDAAWSSTYRGVTYQFVSDEDRRLFAAAPEKYLPTYGGWCATAMGAKGTKVEVDPTNFKVKDGRLFLFYKSVFVDASKDWNKHEKEWEPAADRNWKTLTHEEPIMPPR